MNTDISNKPLRIVFWNVRGITPEKLNDLDFWSYLNEFHVWGLTEARVESDQTNQKNQISSFAQLFNLEWTWSIKHLQHYAGGTQSTSASGGKNLEIGGGKPGPSSGGILSAVRDDITDGYDNRFKERRIKLAQKINRKHVIIRIITVYRKPGVDKTKIQSFFEALDNHLGQIKDNEFVIIGGDFNAHIEKMRSDYSEDMKAPGVPGKALLDFFKEDKWTFLSDKLLVEDNGQVTEKLIRKYTFVSSSAKSVVDYVIVNKTFENWILKFQTTNRVLNVDVQSWSDHRPLEVYIQMPAPVKSQTQATGKKSKPA